MTPAKAKSKLKGRTPAKKTPFKRGGAKTAKKAATAGKVSKWKGAAKKGFTKPKGRARGKAAGGKTINVNIEVPAGAQASLSN